MIFLLGISQSVFADQSTQAAPDPLWANRPNYSVEAAEVTSFIQSNLYLPRSGLYARAVGDGRPDFMWGNGITFSALLAGARHYPNRYLPITNHFFLAMNAYWDQLADPPGYEPGPTRGNGNDKYYDDNAWMVLTFTEAYEFTHDPRYLNRAQDCLSFVLSGWDDKLGGGIWWHAAHKGNSKNTCGNAPAAIGCLRLARYLPPERAHAMILTAEKIVNWTDKSFRDGDALYADSINVSTGKINKAHLTYNTGLMIRALLGLYRGTGKNEYLIEARQSTDAADWFVDAKTHAYRDPFKWSHLLVEADLEMFRATGQVHYLKRALDNADFAFAAWKQNPPRETIDNASIARMLWLAADMQTARGQQFWHTMERNGG